MQTLALLVAVAAAVLPSSFAQLSFTELENPRPRCTHKNANLTNIVHTSFLTLTSINIDCVDAGYGFYTTIPEEIGQFTQLTSLIIKGGFLTGSVPAQMSALTRLEHLEITDTAIDGTIPSEFGGMTALTLLNLSNSELSGLVPTSFWKFSNLELMDLSYPSQDGLAFIFDPFFTNLTSLSSLRLRDMTAVLYSEVAALTNLRVVDVSHSVGTIANEFYDLTDLKELRIADYSMSIDMTVDSMLMNLVNLTLLDISSMPSLTRLPSALEFMLALETLDVSDNSMRSLESLNYTMPSLKSLDLSDNMFVGTITANWTAVPGLEALLMAENEVHALDPAITALTSLMELDISDNWFSSYPPPLSLLTHLTKLSLARNGDEDNTFILKNIDTLSSLRHLDVNSLNLYNIPSEISALTNLTFFAAVKAHPFLMIPSEFFQLTNLEILSLRSCQITSPLPEEFEALTNLVYLDLANNDFHSSAMEYLTDMERLLWLDLSNNHNLMSAPLDFSDGVNFTNLRVLYLTNTSLFGTLPVEINALSNLLYLGLGHNYLRGAVPELTQLTWLQELDFFNNSLTSISYMNATALTNLRTLNIATNKLNTSIPSGLADFSFSMQNLDLSDNMLTSTIPSEFMGMSHLTSLDVSNNLLSGSVTSNYNAALSSLKIEDNCFSGIIPSSLASISNLDVNAGSTYTGGSHCPTEAPTAAPSTSPSTSPSVSPTTSPTRAPSTSPTTSHPSTSPTASPTRTCQSPLRVLIALDRTYASDVRTKLEFGVEVLREVIDEMNQVNFACTEMVFASLLRKDFSWMVHPTNPDRTNGTQLAIASRNTEIGADWRAGFNFRSLALAELLDEGALSTFCGQDSECHLIILSDGKFRSRKERNDASAALRQAAQELSFETSCVFPAERDARTGLNRITGACDHVYHPGNSAAAAAGSDIAHRVMGDLLS